MSHQLTTPRKRHHSNFSVLTSKRCNKEGDPESNMDSFREVKGYKIYSKWHRVNCYNRFMNWVAPIGKRHGW